MLDRQRKDRSAGWLSKEQALKKIKHFCAYQERCHSEVKEKLYSMGLRKTDVESLIARLIEENYLNEERFAIAFAGGKFRIKQWGRVKIIYELKQKKISPYCIKKAMQEIDDDTYLSTFKKIFLKKWDALKSEKNSFVKKRKLNDYMLQKGYEFELLNDMMRSVE